MTEVITEMQNAFEQKLAKAAKKYKGRNRQKETKGTKEWQEIDFDFSASSAISCSKVFR